MQKVIVTILFILLTGFVLWIFSKNVPPSSELYSIKRLDEKIILLTKVTPKEKAKYYSELLDIRLKELEKIAPVKSEINHKLILPTSLRYSTTAGEYTQILKENNLKQLTPDAKKQFQRHKKILRVLADQYQKRMALDDSAKFITDCINYLSIYEKELP